MKKVLPHPRHTLPLLVAGAKIERQRNHGSDKHQRWTMMDNDGPPASEIHAKRAVTSGTVPFEPIGILDCHRRNIHRLTYY